MPVSFKVPKSTKRSKYVIDTFKGVDFTNAGIDVDSSRSPYAPNMVRHTPGKVRKRMGYETEFKIGSDLNMNYAIGTSAEEQEIYFTEGSKKVIYNLLEPLTPAEGETATIYLDFEFKAAYITLTFSENNPSLTMTIAGSRDEWTHVAMPLMIEDKAVECVAIYGVGGQHIYLKNFALLKSKDSNYKWSPAPKNFYSETGDNTFYGSKIYQTPLEQNKRDYTNINRAKGGPDYAVQFYPGDDRWVDTYIELVEEVYRNIDNTVKRQLYVEFDYEYIDANPGATISISIANKVLSKKIYPSEERSHYSHSFKAGNYESKGVAIRFNNPGGGTLRFYNFFVGYAKDDNYSWWYTPEETSNDSWTPDLYYKGTRNYSTISEFYFQTTYHTDTASTSAECISASATGVDAIKGFFYAKANIHIDWMEVTNFSNNGITVYCVGNDGYKVSGSQKEYHGGKISDIKYEIYAAKNATTFPTKIGIKIEFISTVDREMAFSFSDLEIRSISPRDIFNERRGKNSVFHIGSNLWLSDNKNAQKIYSSLATQKSWMEQFENDLIILDGNDIITYILGDERAYPLEGAQTYMPTITISRSPSGGGQSYEPLNLLNPGFIEGFTVTSETADATEFQLSFSNLDSTTVRAWQLYGNGTWGIHHEGTNFTVNRATGVVTFLLPPGITPISGQDNIRIEAFKTIDGYRDKIAKCRFATVYGVDGRPDRLFVSGNPNYPNQDFFSQQNDYTYFPDVNYSYLGAGGGITGYAKIGNYLGTFKLENDLKQSLIIREGVVSTVEDGSTETTFRIVNTLQGESMVSPYTLGYLGGEPLYLSKQGIFAVTTSDGNDNKYGQNRSFYLNGKLTEEPNLKEAYSTIFKDMYVLALNSHLYILDGLQPSFSDKDPYSTRQYSGFYCDNIPATCIWSDDNELYFGTADGKLCKFYSDYEDKSCYNDDGHPISAWWETPDLDGYLFYKNKTFRYFAIRMMKAFRTSFKLYSEKYSVWSFIKEDDTTGRTFDFNHIDFTQFSFSTDTSEKISHTKLRIKKVDKARFKIENSKLNQPFGIYDLALEYIENGNYKR